MTGRTKSTRQEQRRYPRYSVDARLVAHVFQDGALSSAWGRIHEMGEDGLSATLTGELSAGDVISLEFCLPLSTMTIKVRALVRYRDGFRYGFEFLTLTPEQRHEVRHALQVLPVSQK
jgi:PilZ domain